MNIESTELQNSTDAVFLNSVGNANTRLASGLYCIKVQANHDCWIADWDGDPGRTLVKENAKTFKRKSDAEKLCNEMKVKYPNRNIWVDVF
jgi:hypothetical protein